MRIYCYLPQSIMSATYFIILTIDVTFCILLFHFIKLYDLHSTFFFFILLLSFITIIYFYYAFYSAYQCLRHIDINLKNI